MVIKTWGLVPTSSGTRCVRLELRAEAGIMFRVSGVSHQAMMAAQARIRSALLSVNCKWPGKAIWRGVPRVGANDVDSASEVIWLSQGGWWRTLP